MQDFSLSFHTKNQCWMNLTQTWFLRLCLFRAAIFCFVSTQMRDATMMGRGRSWPPEGVFSFLFLLFLNARMWSLARIMILSSPPSILLVSKLADARPPEHVTLSYPPSMGYRNQPIVQTPFYFSQNMFWIRNRPEMFISSSKVC